MCQTVENWLKTNDLSNAEIDFIETVLTFTSAVKVISSRKDEINKSFQINFPNKKAIIEPDLTYKKLEETLKENGINIDLSEMLTRFRKQGICSKLCKELLDSRVSG